MVIRSGKGGGRYIVSIVSKMLNMHTIYLRVELGRVGFKLVFNLTPHPHPRPILDIRSC